MKTLLMIALLAGTAFGQYYIPCLIDVSPPGINGTTELPSYLPGVPPTRIPAHIPDYREKPADTAVYKVRIGGHWAVPVWMPTAGRCGGKFESYDDRDDLAVAATDALGNAAGVRPRVKGDIEIIIVDEFNYQALVRNRSYVAAWSSGRAFSGDFNVHLPPGWYRFVISNQHSYLAQKSVTFTLGTAPPLDTRTP